MIKNEHLLKTILNSRPECKQHGLFATKMAKIETLFLKTTLLGTAHTYIAITHPSTPHLSHPVSADIRALFTLRAVRLLFLFDKAYTP